MASNQQIMGSLKIEVHFISMSLFVTICYHLKKERKKKPMGPHVTCLGTDRAMVEAQEGMPA